MRSGAWSAISVKGNIEKPDIPNRSHKMYLNISVNPLAGLTYPSTPSTPMLTSNSASSEFSPIWDDCRCMLASSWPKSQVMVLWYLYGTYMKYFQPLESSYWPGVILKYIISMLTIAIVLHPNSALFGVVASVWWHHHGPTLELWCFIIHLRPI